MGLMPTYGSYGMLRGLLRNHPLGLGFGSEVGSRSALLDGLIVDDPA